MLYIDQYDGKTDDRLEDERWESEKLIGGCCLDPDDNGEEGIHSNDM